MSTFVPSPGKTPLVRKLGYRPDQDVVLVDPPEGFASYLAEEGISCRVWPVSEVASHAAGVTGARFVHLFVDDADTLREAVPQIESAMARDGMLWVSWPKKASKVPTNVTEDVIRNVALQGDLVDVKVCAVSAVWSGLKLVIRKVLR